MGGALGRLRVEAAPLVQLAAGEELRAVLVLDVRHDQHIGQRHQIGMNIAGNRQRHLGVHRPRPAQRLDVRGPPVLQAEPAVQQPERAQRGLAHGDARPVPGDELHVRAAARVEVVPDLGGHEDGVAIEAVEADQVIEERPREVLDPARHRGTHPAQIDERAQRRVGAAPSRAVPRRWRRRSGSPARRGRGAVETSARPCARIRSRSAGIWTIASTTRSARVCASSASRMFTPSSQSRPSAPTRVDTTHFSIAHASRILFRIPEPKRSGTDHDRGLGDIGPHVGDESRHHHAGKHRQAAPPAASTSRPTIQNSASGTLHLHAREHLAGEEPGGIDVRRMRHHAGEDDPRGPLADAGHGREVGAVDRNAAR